MYFFCHRLTYAGTMLLYSVSMRDTLFKFFTVQKDLQVVRLTLFECPDEVVKRITFHILQTCANLREFHFESSTLKLKWDEVPRFIALISKLQYLRLRSIVVYEKPKTCMYEAPMRSPSPKGFTLSTLKLDESMMDNDLWAIILKNGFVMKHLNLHVSFDNILPMLFKHLVRWRYVLGIESFCAVHSIC